MRHEERIAADRCELKSCPFCGEYVKFDISFELSRLFTGECPGCGMKFEYREHVTRKDWLLNEPSVLAVHPPLFEKHNAPFVEVWNTRIEEVEE